MAFSAQRELSEAPLCDVNPLLCGHGCPTFEETLKKQFHGAWTPAAGVSTMECQGRVFKPASSLSQHSGNCPAGGEEAVRAWEPHPCQPARDLVLSSELQCLQSLVDLAEDSNNWHPQAERVGAGAVAF